MSKYGVISDPYFSVSRLNTKNKKYGPEITPKMDFFHAVICFPFAVLELKLPNRTMSKKLHYIIPGNYVRNYQCFFHWYYTL